MTNIKSLATNIVLFCLIVFIFPSSAAAGNFATCVLDRMPSVQNDAAVYAVMQACSQKYPGGYQDIPQGAGRGWFGYDSGAECTVKKAGETPNRKAGIAIRVACNCLYNEPLPRYRSPLTTCR